MSAKGDFLENKESLNLFFEYLKSSDPELNRNDSDEAKHLFAIQKSSFVLMLYNVIESTVTNLIEKIIDLVVSYSPRLEFKDFNKEIRKLWIRLQAQRFLEIDKVSKSGELAELYASFCEPTDWKKYKFFENMEKVKNALGASGNLDFKKIKDIFGNFNIKIETSGYDPSNIKDIKDLRNKLAHGNVSFLQGVANKTIAELEKCKDATLICLERLIRETEEYCESLQTSLEEKIKN